MDAAHIGGAHRGEREEAVCPRAHVERPLVDAKETLEPAGDARFHAEQLA